MARKLRVNRIYWVVHRTGEERPVALSWISEKAAQAAACRVVEQPVLNKRGYLNWNDLRRMHYYSAQAILTWQAPRALPA